MSTQAELQPGTLFAGDFVVGRLLGRGGMGAVYVAQQRSTNVARALKVMRPELLPDARLRARFEREAVVASGVASEHVVKVLAAGFDATTSMPYIVSELLDGQDLEAYIAGRGALPWSEAALLLAQICHGLGEAHMLGVVHRDLKPENLFVARSHRADVPFTVKILDFGIAKVVADAIHTSQATQSLGTPLYMAPEQADPRAGVSPATDVWALALVVFRMLTGRHYWLSANIEGAGLHALLAEALTAPIAAPSHRVLELQCPVSLPAGFDAWFLTCLQRDPRQRFPTAHDAWNAIAQLSPGSTGPIASAVAIMHQQDPAVQNQIPTMTVGPHLLTPAGALAPSPIMAQSPAQGPSGTELGPGYPQAATPMAMPAQTASTGGSLAVARTTAGSKKSGGVIGLVIGAVALLALAGSAGALAVWNMESTSYCAAVAERWAEPSCILELSKEVASQRSRTVRLSRKRGHTIRAELVNGAGEQVANEQGISSWTFDYPLLGKMRERRTFDDKGRLKAIARFSADHQTIDMFGPEGHQRETGGGHYTRIRLELDKHGMIVRERFMTEKDSPATDLKGAFGHRTTYDARGLATEIVTLGSDGNPAFDDDWMQKVVITYDERGEQSAYTCTTEQGKPAPTYEGCYGAKIERDASGNVAKVTCLGEDGKPSMNSLGFAGWGAQYDGRGNTVDVRYIGTDGSTVHNKSGIAGVKRTYDPKGRETSSTYFAKDGSPVSQDTGTAGSRGTWDANGNLSELVFVGVDGKPTWRDGGYSVVRYKYDDRGRKVETSYLSPEGQPVWTDERFHIERQRYDEFDNVIERAYFGPDGAPAMRDGGYATVRMKYDDHGRVIEESFLGPDGAPIRNEEWIATRRSSYDDWGRETESAYLGPDGKPTRHKSGFAVVKRKFNERNVVIEWTYFNADGQPTWSNDEVGAIRVKVDALGRELERSHHDPAGRLINDSSGTATIKRTLDDKGRVTETVWLDALGGPKARADGACSERTKYDAVGRPIEVSRHDAQGKLLASRGGQVWATRKLQYDDRGQLVQESWFDDAGAPAGVERGAAAVRTKRDDHGRVIEWIYFDGAGKPVRTRSGYAMIRTNRDPRGRQVDWAYFDGEGKRVTTTDGYAISRAVHDERGLRVESTFHDENDKLVLNAEGIAVVKRTYDARARQLSEKYFGADNAPKVSRGGAAGMTYAYDERDLVVERVMTDTEGKPSKGYLIARYKFDDRGNRIEFAVVDSSGEPGMNTDNFSFERSKRDERGRVVEASWFDKADKPVVHKSKGGATIRYKYDDHGIKREEVVMDVAGKVVRTRRYDATGKETAGP
ncbi:MAG: protein kinase [Deltaproteobacteria bacterium]|nr:protein kinase [Deltaproteobacteria bacterium]